MSQSIKATIQTSSAVQINDGYIVMNRTEPKRPKKIATDWRNKRELLEFPFYDHFRFV